MEQTLTHFSLLFSQEDTPCFQLSDTAANDLSLETMSSYLSCSKDEQNRILQMLRNVPTDRETIAYRQSVYGDLKRFPDIFAKLYEIFDQMQFYIRDERTNGFDSATIWDLVNRLRGLQNYANSITEMQTLLKGKEFASEGLQKLSAYIDKIYSDSGFDAMTKDLESLSKGVDTIHSLTLGVNLDANLQPTKVGILSLNRYDFAERGLLEQFFDFHRQKVPKSESEPTPFVMFTHQEKYITGYPSPLMNNLTEIVEEMMPKVTKHLRKELEKYIDISGMALAKLGDELLFYMRCISLEEKLTARGLPCCIPVISDTDTHFHDFYNVKLALCTENSEQIVCNDLEFTKDKTVLILTGPNRGGKTILTQAIGLTMLLFQHGTFVPCSSAEIRICDNIFTHFPADENQTVTLGRLGEEAERFSKLWEQATPDSLLLMNESFASTSHSEALYISEDVLKCLCCLGARTCFNTHMHELAEHTEQLLPPDAVCGAASLIMGKRGSSDAFRIRYEKPNGKSYAHEIAQKYGITYEQLTQKFQSNS